MSLLLWDFTIYVFLVSKMIIVMMVYCLLILISLLGCHIPILEISRSWRARIWDPLVPMKILWRFWEEGHGLVGYEGG